MTHEQRAKRMLSLIKPHDAYFEIDVKHLVDGFKDVEQQAFKIAGSLVRSQNLFQTYQAKIISQFIDDLASAIETLPDDPKES